MTRTTLKKNIHKAVDNIKDDSVLEAVYTLLCKVNNDDYEWDEDLRIVEERRAAYLSGKEKAISISEAKRRLKKKFGK